LVHARLGRHGGYWLPPQGGTTSILAIVEAVEGDARRQRCVLSSTQCDATNRCHVHDIFARAQQALINRLAETSLDAAVAPALRRGRA
jgi:DNA-binding IscR family transcriptional regulator